MNRTGKRCSSWQPIAMHYYFGPPMHLLSGVDNYFDRPRHAYERASRIILNGVSAARRTALNPPAVMLSVGFTTAAASFTS